MMRSFSPISARTDRFVESSLGQNPESLRAHLTGQQVEIALQPEVGDYFAGQLITFTLLNLLVRLDEYCPQLTVQVPQVERQALVRLLEPGPLPMSLRAFFAPFPAASRLAIASTPPLLITSDAIRVMVGPEPVLGSLSVWSKGWAVYLNERPSTGNEDNNPVGACVAAGLAVSEIFKRLLVGIKLPIGLIMRPIERLVFSAYDYGLVERENPPLPPTINGDGAVVVGLGGIGAGFVAAAASLPALVGTLTLVDKDMLDDTNLNRHLVARPGDTGLKVDLCRRALAFHADVEARSEWYEDFLEACGDKHDIVVVGVDKDPVRRAIQASLPKIVLNAGTSDLASFRVTRHNFLDGACLSCISRGDIQDHPEERELARQLGLDLNTILTYQSTGEPLSAALLQQGGRLSAHDVEQLAGLPVGEIRVRVCAQVRLGTESHEEDVSISFLSALPGFLLLGELIKERSYPGRPRPPLNAEANHALVSLFGRPHEGLLRGWRDKLDGCDCTRAPYQRAYKRKWA